MPLGKKIFKQGDIIGDCTYLYEDPSNFTTKGLIGRKATFKCRCGNTFIAKMANVANRHTQSCGCVNTLNVKSQGSHLGAARGNRGKSGFGIWSGIKNRCHNPSCPEFKYYGRKGISVCDRWVSSFENFLEDMGCRPSLRHSIDRIDNSKGYSKENCRWATKEEQMNNMTTNLVVHYRGMDKTMAQWCKELGLNYQNASRIYRRYECMEYVVIKHVLKQHSHKIQFLLQPKSKAA